MLEFFETQACNILVADLKGCIETLTREVVVGSDHTAYVPLDISLRTVKNWIERPKFPVYDPYYKDPARLIVTKRASWSEVIEKTTGFWFWEKTVAERRDYPEVTTLQVHIPVNFPVLKDSGVTAIYVLSLDNNPSLYSYLNFFTGDHSEIDEEIRRPATLSDLQAFQSFLYLGQPINS